MCHFIKKINKKIYYSLLSNVGLKKKKNRKIERNIVTKNRKI